MQIKKQQLELDMEQWTGSKLGKEYAKAKYCHPAYLIYMQSITCKMPGWMKHKLESRLPGEISITSDMQMTPPLWKKAKYQRGCRTSKTPPWTQRWSRVPFPRGPINKGNSLRQRCAHHRTKRQEMRMGSPASYSTPILKSWYNKLLNKEMVIRESKHTNW